MKRIYRTTAGIAGMVMVLAVCSATTRPSGNEFRNLKVLPKDISSKALSKIMVDDFQDALGVSCNFCHAEEKGSHRLDYASDSKPEKEIARAMMRMTLRINKQFFKLRHPAFNETTLEITCNTCHNGRPHPDNE